MPGNIHEPQRTTKELQLIRVSLFKLEVWLATNPDKAGRWSPEPTFRKAFIEARKGYITWYASAAGQGALWPLT